MSLATSVMCLTHKRRGCMRPIASLAWPRHQSGRLPTSSHFSEWVTGAASIRASSSTEEFTRRAEWLVDQSQRCYYPVMLLWLKCKQLQRYHKINDLQLCNHSHSLLPRIWHTWRPWHPQNTIPHYNTKHFFLNRLITLIDSLVY